MESNYVPIFPSSNRRNTKKAHQPRKIYSGSSSYVFTYTSFELFSSKKGNKLKSVTVETENR